MKRLLILALALGLLLSACAGTPQTIPAGPDADGTDIPEAPQAEDGETTPAALPDITTPAAPETPEGYLAVSGPMEIEAQLVLDVALPNLAEDARYGLVNGQYAYVTFTFEGVAYAYTVGRGSVPGDKRAYANQADETWLDAPYTLAWSDDGSGYAAWQRGEIAYRLAAEEGTDADKLRELAILLMPAG